MLDLNSATIAQIANLEGVSLAEAMDIHLWQPFRSWEDLEGIPGFDNSSVDRLRAAGGFLTAPVSRRER